MLAWANLFELGCLATFAVLAYHSYKRLGHWPTAGVFGLSALLGWLMEWHNSLAFQAYAYPDQYWLVLPGSIPLCIALGWSIVIYACFSVATRYGLIGAIMTAVGIDACLEPLAFYASLWTWLKPSPLFPSISYFGAPVGNLIGWILFVGIGTAFWLNIVKTRKMSDVS